jgi:hypothetical protein
MPSFVSSIAAVCSLVVGVGGGGGRVFPLVDTDNSVIFLLVVCAQPGFERICLVVLWIVCCCRACFWVGWWWGFHSSTESLILAQDERWRRA